MEIKGFLKQLSHYSIAQISITLASFISFPILTRVLSQSEYGVFCLVTATVLSFYSFLKLGLPHSSVRFYSDIVIKENKKDIYFASYFWFAIFSGLLFSFLLLPLLFILDESTFGASGKIALLVFVCGISVKVGQNILMSMIKAELKTKLLNVLNVLHKYSSLGLGLAFVLLFGWGVPGMFMGTVIIDVILFSYLVRLYCNNLGWSHYNQSIINDALKYGLPFLMFELSTVFLQLGDRFLIKYFLDENQVAVYSAGYNMSSYAAVVITAPIITAVFPAVMSSWAEKGKEATEKFLSNVLDLFILVSFPILVGISLIGKDALTIVATAKYTQAYTLIPWIAAGSIIYSLYSILGVGMMIEKKTTKMTFYIIIACIANVLLNIVLIPLLGLLGSAIATFLAYSLMTILIAMDSRHTLIVAFRPLKIMGCIIACLVMTFCIRVFSVNVVQIAPLIKLLSEIAIGVISYSLVIMLIFPDMKKNIMLILSSKLSVRNRNN